ncbi:MAG: (2Fe-2S)-binding protein [Proteobacteria bacterium]|nr:(2Fe-2S)-binding protein [Pseudomonadota bacterium]
MASSISITIDGSKIIAPEGESLLYTALNNGCYIPHLCAIEGSSSLISACRLCFVEIEGQDDLVSACTAKITQGMVVNTQSAKVLRLVRTGFELLMASHLVECAACSSKGSCELQRIAKHLGIKLTSDRFRKIVNDVKADESNPAFINDTRKCVLCGRCLWVCREQLGKNMLGFVHRGFDRVVATFADECEIEAKCRDCGECTKVCPTGALTAKFGERLVEFEGAASA